MRMSQVARFLIYNKDIFYRRRADLRRYILMSIAVAEELLRRYNSQKAQNSIVEVKPEKNKKKLGTWSYVNTYDALYDKYSKDKNFNLNMWHDAIKRGEQDAYLGFLEQNKDTDLSSQFYDPGYYDYETMMLELYKGQADDTNKTERFDSIYDAAKNEFVEQSIGFMTDKEHVQYQLDRTYDIRRNELERQREQEEKDQMSWFAKFGNDILATLGEFGEGVLTGIFGVVDLVASPIFATGKSVAEGGSNWFDNFVDYFGDYSLTSMEKESLRAALDDYERKFTHFRDVDGNMTGVGTYVAGMANSIGMMVPAIVSSYLGAPGWVSKAIFYSGIFTGNMYENATSKYRVDSASWLKIVNAGLKTGAELVIETALGKFLGGTIQNRLIGIGGKRTLSAALGRGAGVKYVLKSALQEGLEEFLQDFGTDCIDKVMSLWHKGYAETGVTFQTLIDSFLVGALSSIVMSSGQVGTSAINSAAVNHKAKKAGTYDTKNKIGPGDLVIEENGKAKKVGGFKKLYLGSILSDFQEAVKELKDTKLKSGESIKLAQEIYGAIDVLSQYYSSFDKERIKNCETLLNAVIKAEELSDVDVFRKENTRAGRILSDDTLNRIVKKDPSIRKDVEEYRVKRRTIWADYVEHTFGEMVYGVSTRLSKDTEKAKTTEEPSASKDSGVTDESTKKISKNAEKAKTVAKDPSTADELAKKGTTSIVLTAEKINDTLETKKTVDPELQELADKALKKKAQDILAEFADEYSFVFVTDGEDIVVKDDVLFVPVDWLNNYTKEQIYDTLDRSKALKLFVEDEDNRPFLQDVLKFVREFTGQTEMTVEDAFMQLMFNESVYQAFLLTGENAHTHKKIVFRLVSYIENLAKSTGYLKKQARVPTRISNLLKKLTDAKNIKGFYEDLLRELTDISSNAKNDVDRYAYKKLIERVQKLYEQHKKYKTDVAKLKSDITLAVKEHFTGGLSGGLSDVRIKNLNRVVDEMKKAMRPGTLKAIVNWGFDAEELGAWKILTPRDMQFINAVKQRRNVLKGLGTKAEYKHLVDETMPHVPSEFRTFVREGLEKPVNHPDRAAAVCILDWCESGLSRFHTNLDFELKSIREMNSIDGDTIEWIADAVYNLSTDIPKHLRDKVSSLIEPEVIRELSDKLALYSDALRYYFAEAYDENYLTEIIKDIQSAIEKYRLPVAKDYLSMQDVFADDIYLRKDLTTAIDKLTYIIRHLDNEERKDIAYR